MPAPTAARALVPSPEPRPVPTAPVPVPAAAEITVLSPFQVKSDQDYGYLKTNSTTATRIGTEIQKVPLFISVISEEFIKDANLSELQDVLRYQSSTAGDTKMGILQPATGFTPSGNLSMRGFPINSRLRNGLLRYNAYNIDTVDRIEVIKGPASVFFGNAFPGGVVNYVTKQPEFRKIPTSVTYAYGGWDTRRGGQRVTLDHNHMLSNRAAVRLVGAWDNAKGDRRFEFQDGFSMQPSLTLVPLKSGKLRFNLEAEFLQRQRNQDDSSWIHPPGWFEAYERPPANLIAIAGLTASADPIAAYRARIFGNIGQWITDVRNAANDPYIPLWTAPLKHGAYYTDRAGRRIHDEKFNYYGPGSYSDEENSTFSATMEASPFPWLDIRYSYTGVQSRFDRLISSAAPYADGIRFNTVGITKQGYEIDADYSQLDLVFKKHLAAIDHKLLAGGFVGETYNTFTGGAALNLTGAGHYPFFGNLPGAFDKPDEGYISPIPASLRSSTFGSIFAQEFVRSRSGQILTPVQIYTLYDPGVHPFPDIRRIAEVSRGLVDHSRPRREEWYVNYQGTAWQDRLTVFLGYRQERTTTPGQLVEANPPWYTVSDFPLQNVPRADWLAYGLSEVFSRARTIAGASRMAGASFEISKGLNLYASYSQTFLPSGVQYLGGDTDPNLVRARAGAQGINPGTAYDRLLSEGFLTPIENEKGRNMEVGAKLALADNRLVGTVSLFRVRRENRTLDDFQRQFDDPINYTGPNRTGTYNRVVRWFAASAVQETEGVEFEGVWTPHRNYQAFFSGAWMWKAATVADPSLTVTPANPALARPIVFGHRLPYAPEYRLNLFNKYTFARNLVGDPGPGLSVGFGARYASQINISLDQNFNPGRGGLTAGNYTVFDSVFSYPFEAYGNSISASLNVNNVFDREYSEGNFSLSPPRSWTFTMGVRF